MNATDIHIVPKERETAVFLRVQHDLSFFQKLSLEDSTKVISHFKFMAGLDIGEKRKPQSGAYFTFVNDIQLNLRLSTLPTSFSESLVIRILPPENAIPLEQLSLFPTTTKKLLALIKHAHGLILFTGPTGSGKTTTLYTLLQYSSQTLKRNIISLEDPIEKMSSEILQVQVNEKAGITYSSGLKAILRHDPDVIVVGEIRDEETAQIAVRASLTGHLVLSSMHTRDAPGAVTRLLEFGVKRFEIEQALIAVTAQRLVLVQCPFCGGNCSVFCPLHNRKRACIYEIIHGEALARSIRDVGQRSSHCFRTLREELIKGMALGFITKAEYERWSYSVEE